MSNTLVSHVLSNTKIDSWSRLFTRMKGLRELHPEQVFEGHQFIAFNHADTMYWIQVLGAGGGEFGVNIHRGSVGLRAFLVLLSIPEGHDDALYGLMRELNCLSLSFEDREILDETDQEIVRTSGYNARGKGAWPLIRSCLPGYYPWFPDSLEIELATKALDCLEAALPLIKQDPQLVEPDDENLVGEIFCRADGTWQSRYIPLPDLDDEPAHIPGDSSIDGKTLQRITGLAAALPRNQSRIELGVIVLSSASDPGDFGRPFYPQVIVGAEAKTHAMLAHEIYEPVALTLEAWRNCLLESIEVMGALPARIDTDHPVAAAAVESVRDILGIVHKTDCNLKSLEVVSRAIDQML